MFSTKGRQGTISEQYEGELYAYIAGIIRQQGGVVRSINGMADHVHLLLDIPATTAVATFIKTIKQHSSIWLSGSTHFPHWDGWGRGYAVFSCSIRALSAVLQYVNNQKQHHKKASFEEELRTILREAGIAYDERNAI